LFASLQLDGMPEIGVPAHAVTVAADINNVAVMHESVDQGCRDDLIA
jgi:hypothetical protein